MKTFLPFVLFFLYSCCSFAQAPKSTFIVKIGDQEQVVTEGQELTIPPSDQPTVLSIKLSEHKTLKTDKISFDYPSNFSFETESDIGFKSWTLDGNDYIVTVFEFAGGTELNDFAEGLVGQFGKENCKIKKMEQSIGPKKLSGIGIDVTLIGQKLTYNILEIFTASEKSCFLVLQDSPKDNGNPSDESIETLEMIGKSVVYHE
ncbi:MAG: hypothetical protein AAF990_25570 [Bacteroidota bacterium]